MTELEKKKIVLSIKRAEAAIEEIEIKIIEREEEINRMKEHIGLQEKIIEEQTANLKAKN